MDFPRTALALRILEMLANGHVIPFYDAVQLRNWAVRPQDAILSLKEIADGILRQEGNPNARAATQ
jgi:hypothetical protein